MSELFNIPCRYLHKLEIFILQKYLQYKIFTLWVWQQWYRCHPSLSRTLQVIILQFNWSTASIWTVSTEADRFLIDSPAGRFFNIYKFSTLIWNGLNMVQCRQTNGKFIRIYGHVIQFFIIIIKWNTHFYEYIKYAQVPPRNVFICNVICNC